MRRNSIFDKLSTSVSFGDHSSATVVRNGKIIGFTESEGRGRTANGDIDHNGNVSFGISGKSSQGEDGTLETCRILIVELNNKYGASWETPYLVEKLHIDAEAVDNVDANLVLKIQVVRAVTKKEILKELGKTKSVSQNDVPTNKVALFLKKAIELKEGKIAQGARSDITIALNAIDTPAVCFDDVVTEFKSAHGEWAKSLGFSNIWLVGAGAFMVHNLTEKLA
ncbi:hypothetical protein MNBD_GAMMA26-851 [hydrothermal vent metagenome]|uniref:Uncharacterized protein n=1 Tax=hydrothermal vent metagenome TaxID=652676 RepID=A0A3B1BSW2_9ZZZZ